jgi:hypothetical protein
VTAVVSKRQKRNALIIGECVQNRVSKGDWTYFDLGPPEHHQ